MKPTLQIIVLVATCCVPTLCAQSGEENSRVAQLYTEAKAAQARGELPAAIAKYEAILKLAPRLAAGYNNLGSLYFRQRDYGKAVEVLGKGLSIDPAMPSAAALLGMSLYETGRYAEAKPRLETALNANPQDNNVELYLVNTLTKLEDFESAATHLQRLAQRQPADQRIWYLLGKVYMQLSEAALGKMTAIDPNSVWAHELSAELMEGMKNYEGALVEYQKAVEIAPNQPGTHFKLGDLYWSLSRWNEAAEQFKAEMVNDPRNCQPHWKLGNILLQQSQQLDEALSHVDQALKLCPAQTDVRLDRGRILLKLHRAPEALPYLEEGAKSHPTDATIFFALAQAYRATAKPEQARMAMETFRTLDANARAASARQAQEVIKSKQQAPAPDAPH